MARERNKPPTGKRETTPPARRGDSAPAAGAKGGRLAALEKALGYRFRKPALLELAVTHRSFPYESRPHEARTETKESAAGAGLDSKGPESKKLEGKRPDSKKPESKRPESKNVPGTDNEQLEFMGDAVLGLAVTELLFQQFPKQSEGELTRMRASLVSRQRMAAMGEELGLGEALLVGKSAEQNGARRKPALLANAAEAVLAAVYLDATVDGKDGLDAVRKIVSERLLKPEIAAMRAALTSDGGRGALRDAKTLLQERVQAVGAGRLRYADTAQTGPAHQRRFTVEARLERTNGAVMVLGSAEGCSKKEAQQRAAELALKGWARLELREEGSAENAGSADENTAEARSEDAA